MGDLIRHLITRSYGWVRNPMISSGIYDYVMVEAVQSEAFLSTIDHIKCYYLDATFLLPNSYCHSQILVKMYQWSEIARRLVAQDEYR